MKALFDFILDETNVGGDAKDIFSHNGIKAGTLIQMGTKVLAKYLVNSSLESFGLKTIIGQTTIDLTSNTASGNNIIEITLLTWGGAKVLIELTNSNGKFSYYWEDSDGESIPRYAGAGNYMPFKLNIQDTSETPADATITGKMGIAYIIEAA